MHSKAGKYRRLRQSVTGIGLAAAYVNAEMDILPLVERYL